MKRAALIFVTFALAVAYYFPWWRTPKPETPEEALASVLSKVDAVIDLDRLPLEQAIKQVRGNGERVLVSFEDPNCWYCTELDEQLNRLDNLTLYTFLYPILSEDSIVKSRRIWCAREPAASWNDWMLKRRVPSGTEDCDSAAIDRNIELGARLGIRGTPYLLRAKTKTGS